MRDYRLDEGFEELDEPKPGNALRWALLWLACCVLAALAAPALVNRTTGAGPAAAGHAALARPAKAAPAANSVLFPADRSGHFIINAMVNGAPVHFLVDTGATFVVLSDADAQAAGIDRTLLTFDQRLRTADGETRGALVTLRDIRIGQMEQDNVPAMVLDSPVSISLLGMSFLKRLERYEIRDGELTLYW